MRLTKEAHHQPSAAYASSGVYRMVWGLLKPLVVIMAESRKMQRRQTGYSHLTGMRMSGQLQQETGSRHIREIGLMNGNDLGRVGRYLGKSPLN